MDSPAERPTADASIMGTPSSSTSKGQRPRPSSVMAKSSTLEIWTPWPTVDTLRTTLDSCILQFTYIGGPVPSLITGHGQVSHSGNQRPMAHGELTHGMALGGHILWGNNEIIRTNGLMHITGFYPVQAHRVGSLDPMAEPCPKQRRH